MQNLKKILREGASALWRNIRLTFLCIDSSRFFFKKQLPSTDTKRGQLSPHLFTGTGLPRFDGHFDFKIVHMVNFQLLNGYNA